MSSLAQGGTALKGDTLDETIAKQRTQTQMFTKRNRFNLSLSRNVVACKTSVVSVLGVVQIQTSSVLLNGVIFR